MANVIVRAALAAVVFTVAVYVVPDVAFVGGTLLSRLAEPVLGQPTSIVFRVNEDRQKRPQIRQLGANYGLNNDPTSQAYRDYNYDSYSTDFEYLRIKSDLGDGWAAGPRAQ